jgi:hypothetical protein
VVPAFVVFPAAFLTLPAGFPAFRGVLVLIVVG